MKALVNEDTHSAIKEVSDVYCLPIGRVQNLLLDDLQMKQMSAKWVPYLLTDTQKSGGLKIRAV